MKSTHLIIAALLLCSLSSCKMVAPLLKIPGQLIKATGSAVGMGLTDEAPQPYDEESPIEPPTEQGAPQTLQE